MTIPFSHSVRPSESVILRTFDDGESVLLHLETEYYFGLNAVGTRMWQSLTQANTIADAFHDLTAEYAVDPEELRNDLSSLVDELVSQQLLVASPPPEQ